MTTIDGATAPQAEATTNDELSRLRRIASQHGLSGDGLIQLVAEARIELRNRRRRLHDSRLEELVSQVSAER